MNSTHATNHLIDGSVLWVTSVLSSSAGTASLDESPASILSVLQRTCRSLRIEQIDEELTDTQVSLAANSDFIISDSAQTAEFLRAAGIERLHIWTFVQLEPDQLLDLTDEEQRREAKAAVVNSQKVLVFTEEARSALEMAFLEATSNVVVLPIFSGVDTTSLPKAPDSNRPLALCIHVNSTQQLGIEALELYAEQARLERDPLSVLIIGDHQTLSSLHQDSELRRLVAIPGARTLPADSPELSEMLHEYRLLGFLPTPAPSCEHQTRRALSWFQSVGIEIFAERGSCSPTPDLPTVGWWDAESFASDLAKIIHQISPDGTTSPPGVDAVQRRTDSEQLAHCLTPYIPDYSSPARAAKSVRVLLVGADFKFAGDYVEALAQRDDIELKVDLWKNNSTPQPEQSRPLMDWAEIIICEFSSINAIWYSQNLPPTKRLYVHLHGFELLEDWITRLNISAVDKMLFASEFYRQKAIDTMGWPAEKTGVVSNSIQSADLMRPKIPGSRFHLGMVGYVPILKRLDRALDLLELLLEQDDRYVLHLRGHKPWNYVWQWKSPLNQDAYQANFERLRDNEKLRRAVVFEPFGADMGNWFRGIGWTLSPSTRETFHLAPVEGMASGAVPLVWRREGSDEIFPEKVNFDSAEEIAQFVLANNADPRNVDRLATASISFAAQYAAEHVRTQWIDLCLAGPLGQPDPFAGFGGGGILTAAGQDAMQQIRQLAEQGSHQPARTVWTEQEILPWKLGSEDRQLVGRLVGTEKLRQRVQALYPTPAQMPREKSRTLLCLSTDDAPSPTVPSSLAKNHPYIRRFVLPAMADDANLDVEKWAAEVSQLANNLPASRIFVQSGELLATAAAIAGQRLGIPVSWDITESPDVQCALNAARREPNGLDDAALISFAAALKCDELIGFEKVAPNAPVPVELLVRPAETVNAPKLGMIGSSEAYDADQVEIVALEPEQWEEQFEAHSFDAVVIDVPSALESSWRNSDSAGAPLASAQRTIDAALRSHIPLAFIQLTDPDEFEQHLHLAVRTHVAIVPETAQIGRLHDRRRIAAQVATSAEAVERREALHTTARMLRLSL